MIKLFLAHKIALACFIIFLSGYGYCRAAEKPDARSVFTILPLTIFEITTEGLTDADRRELLDNGASAFWEVALETPELMVFAALPFRDRAIGLRVFQDVINGGAVVAIGTLGESVCALELWRLDDSGRLMPMDTPPEPDISDFFVKTHKLSKNINHSILICLGGGGLKAQPLFWNKYGMLPSSVDNEISYQWNGGGFSRMVAPRKK